MSYFKDITGQIFGRYTVLSFVGRIRGDHSYWLCRCSCGNERTVDGQCLKAGKTKSCGCYRNEMTRAMIGRNTKAYGESSFNGLYNNYYQRAKKSGLEFSLTKEEFANITKKNCKYCGVVPAQHFSDKTCNGAYVYNGIDRVSSSAGYTINNSAPCCKTCNYAKHYLTEEEFYKWVNRLIEFNTNPESPATVQGNASTL